MADFLYGLKRIRSKHNNNKFLYYFKNFVRLITPKYFFQSNLERKLKQLGTLDEGDYIKKRVSYYNKLENISPLNSESKTLKDFTLPKKLRTYFFDSYEYTRYFNQTLKVDFTFGDITYVPQVPSILKSRPIAGNNENSVLLNLDKVRHFTFTNDRKNFLKKKDMLVGRMFAHQESRVRFLEMYFNHPMCNVGQINKTGGNPALIRNKMTIDEHLDYKFILSLEGHDVASNLKWIMSSQSLAVMPNPKYETWFMEGTLIPNYHYVEIKADFSDLEDRMLYYIEYPNEALAIVKNANAYIKQFKNKEREDLISLLVLDKYFKKTGQKNI